MAETGTKVSDSIPDDGAVKVEDSAAADQETGGGSRILRYPSDLDPDAGRELMKFSIVARDALEKDQKSIYLYTPAGISAADSASYATQDFGFMGGLQQNANTMAPALRDSGASTSAIKDIASGISLKEAGGAAATMAQQKLSWGVLSQGKIISGSAKNAHTNLQFEGVGMRSFTFAFKMVAESKTESNAIRQIENTFRKFLYPTNEGKLGLMLKYPPYWKIQFFKSNAENGLSENPYLPFIDLCYLRNVSATYNSSTNAFHPDGAPVELDLSLSFDEAQQNIREDLYQDKDNYDSADYTYERGGLQATIPGGVQ